MAGRNVANFKLVISFFTGIIVKVIVDFLGPGFFYSLQVSIFNCFMLSEDAEKDVLVLTRKD